MNFKIMNDTPNDGICIVLIIGLFFYFNYTDQKKIKEEKERKIIDEKKQKEKEILINEIINLKKKIVEIENKIVLCETQSLTSHEDEIDDLNEYEEYYNILGVNL